MEGSGIGARLGLRKGEDTMAFCANCGNKMEDGAAFCAVCGAGANGPAGSGTGNGPAAPEYPEDKQLGYGAMAILAYTGILFLVPLLAGKESPFARYHANQGLVLLLAGVAVNIAAGILGLILGFILPFLAGVVAFLAAAASIALTVFGILGMVNCCKGRMKPLPLIGGIRIIK